MITCLGLVVGVVESPVRQDVLKQCVEFLSNHMYLLGKNVEFLIDGKVYATVIDHCTTGGFGALFEMYDGFTSCMFI